MDWLIRSNDIHTGLVLNLLTTATDKLSNVILSIERKNTYNDEYIRKTIKSIELSIREVRKYIEVN